MATKTFSLTKDERYVLLDGLAALAGRYEDDRPELTKIEAVMDKIDPWYDEDDDDCHL